MMISFFMLLGCLLLLKYLSMEILGYLMLMMMMISFISLGGVMWKLKMISMGSGYDNLSYLMILLSYIVVYMSLLSEKKVSEVKNNLLLFKFLILLILMLLIMNFLVMNVFMFYLFFELVLVPMILLILVYGYQPERLESSIYMFMYTMFGSLPLLMGLLILSNGKSMNFMFMLLNKDSYIFMDSWGYLLLVGFLIKLPMYGFHIWLPKAHVEAPVSGSMILAGMLLKLGCYGFYRFFPFIMFSSLTQSFYLIMGMWGGILSGMACLRQLDMKKLVAYSSVVHSGFLLGGVIGFESMGMYGGLIMMVGHGLCSSGLFLLVNMMYSRIHTRSILLMKGVLILCPSVSIWLFLLVCGNMAAPPFLNFFGEILLGMSILMYDNFSSFLLIMMFFISVGYGIYFYSVVSHGKYQKMMFIMFNVDEFYLLFMHFWPILSLVFGLKYMFI